MNPLFEDTNSYRLNETSPCIDAGYNDYVNYINDLYNNARIWDGNNDGNAIVDIGAFEYGGPCITSSNVTVNICQGESYNGHTATGNYQDTLTNYTGCDSIVFVDLTVNSPNTTNLVENICNGDSVTIDHLTFTENGKYSVTLQNQYGCDSLVNLDLTVNPVHNLQLTESICEGESVLVGDQVYSETGNYTVSLINQFGCDSTVSLTLTVNPVYNHSDIVSICVGESYEFGTQSLTISGEYTEVFQTMNGCDSTVILTLVVNPVYNHTDEITICEGESYQFGTQTLSEAGEYSEVFESQSGCDSTVVLSLNVSFVEKPIISQSGDTLTCNIEGEYIWYLNNEVIKDANAQVYLVQLSGQYQVAVTNEIGCQSLLSNAINVIRTSAENLEFAKKIVVYPNPTDGKIKIVGLNISEEPLIQVFDTSGKKIFNILATSTHKEIDITGFAPGIYHLIISNENSRIDYKIIKK